MTMTVSVYDDIHNHFADNIEYDLWRVNNNRTFIKHDIITDNSKHLLFSVNTVEDLGYYEIVLYIKNYFDRFHENIKIPNHRLIIPVGMNELNQYYQLGIHITPTSHSCVL
jgi:5-hydroxyisourate hydrolase-like protein (transthyretin family)